MTAFPDSEPFFTENAEKWSQIAAAIKQAKRIYITSHVNPDGDSLGSEMAVARFLEESGKNVRVINQSVTPELYEYLDPDGLIETVDGNGAPECKPGTGDLIFFLDMSNYSRSGRDVESLAESGARIVVVDHHVYDGIDGDIVVTNTEASATASLVYDLLYSIDSEMITPRIAEALLTGIITDTGYFSFSNTTQRTLRIAARLYERGTSTRDIRKKLESGFPLGKQKLLGMALSSLTVTGDGRVAYAAIRTEMFKKAGALREHTDGIIEQVKLVKGIHVAVLIIQENSHTFKASFRSMSGVPVNEIARSLGGGGHVKAAGATMEGTFSDVRGKILDTINDFIDNTR